MKSPFKTVLMPIQTPDNDYCWDGKTPCEHFDSTGGHPTCEMGFFIKDRYLRGPVQKPLECMGLKTLRS
jgi:hypothetical protein